MNNKLRIIIIIFMGSIPAYVLAAEKVCDNLYLATDRISLTENEKKLVCDGKTKGWSSIPLNQKISQTKVFLQSRGFFSPEVVSKDEKVIISPGELSKIEKVEFLNAPQGFNREKYIGSIGKDLTPENLDGIKAWTLDKLASIGWPCATAEGRASFETGKVMVKINPKQQSTIKSLSRDSNTRFEPYIFSRYDAFELGHEYNDDFLNLTSQRVINAGLVSYSYFEHECSNIDHLEQRFMEKEPNTMIFGIGGSSEELPIFEFKWKNTGLDRAGSELNTKLYLSSIEQSLEFGLIYYPILMKPRFSLRPNLKWSRKKEDIFETENKKIELGIRKTHDTNKLQYIFEIIPAQSIETNIDSDLPERVDITSISISSNIIEHYFEYYRNSPRKGYSFNLSLTPYKASSNEFETEGSILKIGGTILKNYSDFDPPNLILGTRFFLNSIDTSDLETVPQQFRLYLGGQDDIRGFGRKQINNNEIGFSTTTHLALEARFTSVLPYMLQPYIFYDFAKAGLRPFQLSDELYHSPGIGIRWESPVGNFRTNIAKGMVAGKGYENTESYNFYFSYGREF